MGDLLELPTRLADLWRHTFACVAVCDAISPRGDLCAEPADHDLEGPHCAEDGTTWDVDA